MFRIAALAFCALGAAAAEITTTIDGPSNGPREVSLVARRLDSAADPIELKVAAPGKAEIALPEGFWEIRVVSEGMWAAPMHVENADSATLQLWTAAPLTGTASGITKLRAQFASIDHERVAGEVDCEVAKDA